MGEEKSRLSESETCLLLDTYMYLNYYEAEDGQKLEEILADLSGLPDYTAGGIHSGEYEILQKAVAEKPELGELQIRAQSFQLGYDSGTRACLFQEQSTETVYVVYRGTGDGEWPDNGLGMTQESTIQQQRALSYFEKAMETGGFTEDHRIIITGHSKGGNKAQYVTMETAYENLIDKCYSIDGQGFSDAAVSKWKEKYSQSEYESRTHKLYAINGENDYINVLGQTIIPAEHISYRYTPVEKNNIAGYHDIKYMFAAKDNEGNVIFTGQSNYVTGGQKEWGIFGRKLSNQIMALDPPERAGCAAVIMQLMELKGEKKTGLNGEKVTLSDWQDFFQIGLPTVLITFLFSEEGKGLTSFLFGRESGQEYFYKVVPAQMAGRAEEAEQIALQIEEIAAEVEAAADRLKGCLKYGFPYSIGVCGKLKKKGGKIEKEADQLKQMSAVLETAAQLYAACEQNIADI